MNNPGNDRVKADNRRMILSTIYREGPISRIAISEKLGLTPSTITTYVTKLIDEGTVCEVSPEKDEEGEAKQGRKRAFLDIVPDRHHLIGLDVGPESTYVSVTDMRGKVLAEKRMIAASEDCSLASPYLASLVFDIMKTVHMEKRRFAGLGVSVAGLIAPDGRTVELSVPMKWKDFPLADDLERLTGLRTVLYNNARARSASIELFSDIDVPDVYTYVFSHGGIAAPCIVGPHDLPPRHISPGELGHMIVEKNGRLCPVCGRRGCLETVASEAAMIRDAVEAWKSGEDTVLPEICPDMDRVKIEDLIEAQKRGDPAVTAIIMRAVGYLATAIANLVYVMNPSLIVVDSRVMQLEQNRQHLIKEARRDFSFFIGDATRMEFVPWDRFRGARGAAGCALRDFVLMSE